MENKDLNIPLYRAEILHNKHNVDIIEEFTELIDGKRYAIGLLSRHGRMIEVTKGDTTTFFIIDKTTLAIHFPDTNIKDLFFGLENGKGASIIEAIFIDDKSVLNSTFKGIAIHTHHGYVFFDKNNDWVHITKLKDIKVIGIQKW